MSVKAIATHKGTVIEDPKLAKLLFSDTRLAPVWLVIRVLMGLSWLQAGWGKLGSSDWMSGTVLQGFWKTAVQIPDKGKPPIAIDWYRGFLQGMLDAGAYTWFAKFVAFGELLVGVALIIGAFVGIAAVFGAFMNYNYIMAGAASTNGAMLVAAILVILAWKVAGYWGADYYLLRRIGTPWTWLKERGSEPQTELQHEPA